MEMEFSRRRLPQLALMISIVFAALAISNLVRIALLAFHADTVAPAASVSAPSPRPRHTAIQRILTSGILGTHHTAAPRTSLSFKLEGIYSTGDGQGYAIITGGHGDAQVYTRGDTLPGGARIKAIRGHDVLLATSRGTETLPLADPALGTGGHGVATAASSAHRGASTSAHIHGYRISTRTSPTLMHRLGLRPGDIVAAVNGRVLDNASDGIRAFHAINPGESLKLRVYRDGRFVTLHARIPRSAHMPALQP